MNNIPSTISLGVEETRVELSPLGETRLRNNDGRNEAHTTF